jgi:hypothetical protein
VDRGDLEFLELSDPEKEDRMSVGARNRDADDLWYVQAVANAGGETIPNAAIENILLMDDIQDGSSTNPKLWLESCKCHSMFNAALATRKNSRGFEEELKKRLRGVRGPDYLCVWMNTPQNRALLGIGAGEIMPGERSDLYPKAMEVCFGVINEFRPAHTWEDLIELLRGRSAVVASLKLGHSIMFKGYDERSGELIYVDPYPPRLSGDWRNARMDRAGHDRDIKPFINVFFEEN